MEVVPPQPGPTEIAETERLLAAVERRRLLGRWLSRAG